jgi:hypothetical protein
LQAETLVAAAAVAAFSALVIGEHDHLVGEAIDHHTQPLIADAVTIRTSALGERAEVLGAIALAVQTSLQRAA